ncbi:MAG TPA: DNA mismatch repair protein MutS [bacterium]|jgi:DNA mismatch repair protein MutS|nr:DNA mismatch repair protein MutS [bacterium]
MAALKGPSMMEQYQSIKDQNPDCLLFFRLGDFYELFGEDAKEASRLLGITLTARTSGEGRSVRVPMAGVPFHAASQYLQRLLKAGKKVAICEQMEDPKASKGMVRRELVRVVTPGTALEDGFLDQRSNNYVAALFEAKDGRLGLAWADNATGEFMALGLPADPAALEENLQRLRPSELLLAQGRATASLGPGLASGAVLSEADAWTFEPGEAARRLKEHFGVATLDGFGLAEGSPEASAAGALLAYLGKTQRSALAHVRDLRIFQPEGHLRLDASAQRDLEIVQNLEDGGAANTLFSVVDKAVSAAGTRALKQWLKAPLADLAAIVPRQDAVDALHGQGELRSRLREILGRGADLERIVAKAGCMAAGPRDLAGARQTLRLLPELGALLAGCGGLLGGPDPAPFAALLALLESALVEDPPALLREGGFVKPGFDALLDEAVSDGHGAREKVLAVQEQERARSGNPKLKVQFNSVFGYYIEVSKGQASSVPGDYERKQTLVAAERFTTPGLRAIETRVLTAEARRKARESELFEGLRQKLLLEARVLGDLARVLAALDALAALAEAAARQGWTRPVLDASTVLDIRAGRHPVLEPLLRAQGATFEPNDCVLDTDEGQISLITGPNMAGKSTYMRQTALIVLLAQSGSFVPAASARIGLVDRIFTRVGASDRLSRGMSTFLVEMTETANILRNATRRSLVVLDEIGRGTSTYDGVSIAWAVVQQLHDAPHLGCRTLFATHYFELAELEGRLARVRNYSVAVREWQGKIVFLHSIKRGASEHSYGIAVARLAGIPETVLKQARAVLASLEMHRRPPREPAEGPQALDLFEAAPRDGEAEGVLERLRSLDSDNLTPLRALQELQEMKDILLRGGHV